MSPSTSAAPGAVGVLTTNGILGHASNILQGMNLQFAGYILEKLCPFTNREPWPCWFFPFFSPGVNCSVGQCGLCAPVPVLGSGFSSPLRAKLTAELFPIRDAEAVCRIKAFLVHLQAA